MADSESAKTRVTNKVRPFGLTAKPPANVSPVCAGSANVRAFVSTPSAYANSWTLFRDAPPTYRLLPSGLHASPYHAASSIVVLFTVQVVRSTIDSDGLARPLLLTTAYRPSADSAMFSGKVPTGRCLPAGAMRHPFASSVVPSVAAPGVVVDWTDPDCARVSSDVPTSANESTASPMASRLVVVGETTIGTIKRRGRC